MYTIREAVARTGLSISVLRAWERRYGIVAPARTAGGYRVYDEAALGLLRAMRRLVDDGWAPSAAAAAIADGTAPSEIVATPAAPSPAAGDPAHGSADDPRGLVARFTEAAAALDSGAVEVVLDEMFATGTYERVVATQLTPALRALGRAWEEGAVSVAGEHLASNAVQRRLAAAFQAAGTPLGERPVLVGMPPGSHHELGSLIFATAARRDGMAVAYLGADLPLPDWVAAVGRTGARAVVIGALMPADGAAARSVAAGLRAASPNLLIAFGGLAAPEPEAADLGAGLALRLPEDIAGAVQALRTSVARLRRG